MDQIINNYLKHTCSIHCAYTESQVSYVVGQFFPQFKFHFILFLGMEL